MKVPSLCSSFFCISHLIFATSVLATPELPVEGLPSIDKGDFPELLCFDDAVPQEEAYSAFVHGIADGNPSIEFHVPRPDADVSIYPTACTQDEGAIESAYSCAVMSSTDSGFEFRLFSIGGAELHASVTPWNMLGKKDAIPLKCVQIISISPAGK